MTALQQQSVLVVDDEPFSQGLVAQMARRAGAAAVHVAANGYEALDILDRETVTIVIIDFRMPGIHGLELLKRIRTGKTAAPRNIICVMLTGHAVRHLVGLAIVLDVDTFLAKPVSLETLTKHLGRSLQYRFEPLPIAHYDAVDVRTADDFLKPGAKTAVAPAQEDGTAASAEAIQHARAPSPGGAGMARVGGSEGANGAAASSSEAGADAPLSSPASASQRPPPKPPVPVKIHEIQEGAIIAKNIVGKTGTLLLAAGTPFRARYARRLQEIAEIEGEIEDVWIHE